MRLGSTVINKAYLGANEISKIMLGSVEVFGGGGPVAVSFTTQPSNQSATEGGDATFFAAAAGTEPITLQWQVDDGGGFDDIVGATTGTLVVEDTTLAMDGYVYRCVGTNVVGSTNSSSATLEVTEVGAAVSEVVDSGITFEFASAVTVGQYISGDYWALNATVDSVLPASAQVSGTYENDAAFTDRWVNGLMVDPGRDGGTGASQHTTPQAWDSLVADVGVPQIHDFAYDHAKNLDPAVTTLAITGPATIAKCRSKEDDNVITARDKVARTALLTIVDTAPASDAFRRWGGNVNKNPIFFGSDIDYSVLPSIALPTGATLPDPDALIAKLGPLQTFMNSHLFTRAVNADEQQSDYGANMATDINEAIFYTMMSGVSTVDRNRVAVRIIQAGLDIFDAIEYGRRWTSATQHYGGSYQWIKTPLIYAATLLHNAANTTAIAALIARCNAAANRIFAEDIMLRPVNRATIETIPNETITTRLWPQGYPDWAENTIEWTVNSYETGYAGLSYSIGYRHINANPQMCSVLIARLLNAQGTWGNPQLFDYHDRFYQQWVLRGKLHDVSGLFFPPYSAAMVDEYYVANWGAASGSLSSVRLESRGLYAWIETAENLDIAFQPAASDISVEVADAVQTLTAVSTTASGVASSGSTNVAEPVITVASATGIRVGQRIECGSLPICFVHTVDGTTIGISERIITGFTDQAITFHNTFVWGRSLVAVLPTPLTSDATVVEIGYTAPGSGFVRNLRGTQLSNITLSATTNRTGQLPAGPSTIDTPYSGLIKAERQWSGTIALRSEALRRFRLSMRFVIKSEILQDETWVANSTSASANFRMYATAVDGGDFRVFVGGKDFRSNNSLLALPLDTVITLHMLVDGTATTHTTSNRGVFVWDGGSEELVTTASTGDITGDWASNIQTVFSNGLFVNARGSGTNAPHGGIQALTIGWGDASYTLPADFTGAEFAWNADWGANGQNVWGQNQLYYAGTIIEWNGAMPNRGNYGSLTLSPRRFFDEDTGELLTEYTAYPFP